MCWSLFKSRCFLQNSIAEGVDKTNPRLADSVRRHRSSQQHVARRPGNAGDIPAVNDIRVVLRANFGSRSAGSVIKSHCTKAWVVDVCCRSFATGIELRACSHRIAHREYLSIAVLLKRGERGSIWKYARADREGKVSAAPYLPNPCARLPAANRVCSHFCDKVCCLKRFHAMNGASLAQIAWRVTPDAMRP